MFPPDTFFGIVSAIEGKIFKMLGIVNLAAEQNLNLGLHSVPCNSIRKCQGICEIGDIIWNLTDCMYLQHLVECGPN